jgi:peptidoglycan/xylan/chitin deacetylase (PgdA/CDA1 family)
MSSEALPVLMYHSVSEVDGPARALAVPPHLLGEQLTALREAGYALTGLTEALRRKSVQPQARVIGVTFDDGYLDFLTAGVPVLQEVGATATLYVSVGHLGDPQRVSPDFGAMLSWAQVREVAQAGVEIGNHSFFHEPMDVLRPAALEEQVRSSTEKLRQECGGPVLSFAYPHGYNSRRVRATVARYGHHNACEVGHRLCQPGRDDVYAIPRIQITPDHTAEQTVAAVRGGGPSLVPRLKRAAQPGWRAARWGADRFLGKRLT